MMSSVGSVFSGMKYGNGNGNNVKHYYDKKGICNSNANGKCMKGKANKGKNKRNAKSVFVGKGFLDPKDRYAEMNVRKLR